MSKTGITLYDCEQDEAVWFRRMAPDFDVDLTITEADLTENTISLAAGNRCVSVSHKTAIANDVLHALSQIGVTYISTRSMGYDHIDVDVARSVGITVGSVAYSSDSVADYTLMLMLMSIRQVSSIMDRSAAHDFRLQGLRGKELRDMTVGVIGTGRIGIAVIERLRGFGCRILAYDHHPKAGVDYVPLDALLQQSDIVTLHTPLNADTFHVLDRHRLALLKPGAFVINTGRGSLIDTRALIEALQAGALAGAALDVLEGEQGIFYVDRRNRPAANQLLLQLQKMPNVLITPHAAYYTQHALKDIVTHTITNCLQFERRKHYG